VEADTFFGRFFGPISRCRENSTRVKQLDVRATAAVPSPGVVVAVVVAVLAAVVGIVVWTGRR